MIRGASVARRLNRDQVMKIRRLGGLLCLTLSTVTLLGAYPRGIKAFIPSELPKLD